MYLSPLYILVPLDKHHFGLKLRCLKGLEMLLYERGYTETMEKFARGMYPTMRQLFQMGIKPGSGVRLSPFARWVSKATRKTSPAIVRPRFRSTLTPAEMEAQTLLVRPRTLLPDVREVLRRRAQQAGTYVAV